MRLNDESMQTARTDTQIALVRAVVREEIAKAFTVLAREADAQDGYDTAELDSRALSNIKEAAEGAVRRLTCPHEAYSDWGREARRCSRCGEPEPEPVNPFEENSRG